MEYDPKDNEVIHLLKKLKDSNGAYPPEMLALRREGYLKQVAEVSGGAGLAVALRNIAKGGKGSSGLSSTAGTVVEALLVVALIAEAGAVMYFYRDNVAEYFQSLTRAPKVEEVTSPPVISSPLVELQVTPSPIDAVTLTGTMTLTPRTPSSTPSGTPSPVLAAGTTQPDEGTEGQSASTGGSSSSGSQGSPGSTGGSTGGSSASTPDPKDPKGNSGNHYGQTPKPERTKESGNNPDSTQDDTTNNKNKP